MTKSKKRKWFNSLTNEQKLKYFDKQARKKNLKLRHKSDMVMARMKLSFDCKQCIHSFGHNCKTKKGGCTSFFDAVNDILGPAYKQREASNKQGVIWKNTGLT